MKKALPLKHRGARRKPKARSKGLKHVLKTGLPPGIEREHFRDPGAAIRKKPA
jgi:hypothetical protein